MAAKELVVMPEDSLYSGHELIVIPKNYKFTPSDKQFDEVVAIVQNQYPNYQIRFEIFDSINFVDSGQNFEKITCNLCNKEIAADLWGEKMSESYEASGFQDLNFKTPCCGNSSNLNDLLYEGDCGFASFYVSINNAEAEDNKQEQLKSSIADLLTTEVKVFWRHS